MSTQREAWLDAIRGVTISLVVFNHCTDSINHLLEPNGRQLNFLVNYINGILGLVRMPAFFLCSGILFAVGAKRGWNWFFEKRLLWAVWIVALWSWPAIIVINIGFELYPWLPRDRVGILNVLLIEPTGNMWFIYAIAVSGAFCMIIRKTDPLIAIASAFALSMVALLTMIYLPVPFGIRNVLWNLGVRGLIFFTIGFIFSHWFMTLRRGNLKGVVAALAIWGGCALLLNEISRFREIFWMALSLPATFSAIYVLQYLLTRLPAAAYWLSVVGMRSLHLFLLHQFFIAAAYVALQPLATHISGVVLLSIMFLIVMIASYATANLVEKVPGNPFFVFPSNILRHGAPR